jgi:hypothetical protein
MARELQTLGLNRLMAAKLMMLKLLQELHGFAEVTNRRPPPRSVGLALMQLRSHMAPTRLPPRRRTITIEVKELAETPHPVRITHLAASQPLVAHL